jgi:hypothetical protein
MGYKWKPLTPASIEFDEPSQVVTEAAKLLGCTEDEARRRMRESDEKTRTEYWINDMYQVQKQFPFQDDKVVHLCIRRRDGAACLKDWRHFQMIKNQLVGPECEAVELYPAESRLVDTSNKYHLWCTTDTTFRFPFGFEKRDVRDENKENLLPGLRQRRF